jgi:dUTP pyrophosphatase
VDLSWGYPFDYSIDRNLLCKIGFQAGQFSVIFPAVTGNNHVAINMEIYMNKHKIETKIMNPLIGTRIPLPAYATPGAAAMDLRACIPETLTIGPGDTVLVPSGIAISIHDPGLVALIVPRSGLGIKHGIVLANTIGVIDSDYQGEIGIGIHNRGHAPYNIEPGERICQMMFMPVVHATLAVVEEFSLESARGAGGFGHTGKN